MSQYTHYMERARVFADRIRESTLSAFASQSFGIAYKADGSSVTELDTTIEHQFREAIMTDFPTHGIIGEEERAHNPSSSYQRIIDPIDGTRDFGRGIPHWATLIALMHEGVIVMWLSAMPAMNEMLIACTDTWSPTLRYTSRDDYTDGQPVHVSNRTRDRAYISHARTTHFQQSDTRQRPDLMAPFMEIINRSWYHKNGRAYELHLIATGKIEAHISPDSKLYDSAPFIPIIQQAGGRVTTFGGDPLSLTDTSIIASNGTAIHDDMISILTPAYYPDSAD